MKYKVTQSLPSTQTWEWEIEASSKEEAIRIIESGICDQPSYSVETDIYDEEDYFEVEVIE